MKKRSRKNRSPQARWTGGVRDLPAISVRQPYAWLIVNGFKDVENRGKRMRHCGPILIHAGLNRTWLKEEVLRSIERRHGLRLPRIFHRRGIVGMVEIVDCRRTVPSPLASARLFRLDPRETATPGVPPMQGGLERLQTQVQVASSRLSPATDERAPGR
jgi:hypothetical protein